MVFPVNGRVYKIRLVYTEEKLKEEGIWILH